jgi:hypothetical protein
MASTMDRDDEPRVSNEEFADLLREWNDEVETSVTAQFTDTNVLPKHMSPECVTCGRPGDFEMSFTTGDEMTRVVFVACGHTLWVLGG